MLVVRPCSTKAAYEGILTRQVRLDLNECSKTLRAKGYEIIALTDYVMVVKKEYELTLFPSGRVLAKDVESMDLAKKTIEKLHQDLGSHES
ncbi:MAG: hypothetical protein WED04_12555 [Promethearchaeati archaeon SRVP18_Atabeyarchaeia-1]